MAAPASSRYVVDVARGGRPDIFLVTNEDTLRTVARRLEEEPRVALDIESNGMHAYKATLCVLQLAAKGSVVSIFATGEGQTDPGGIDGRLANDTLPKPKLPVEVWIE